MIRITHVITGLHCGGAENMLWKLLRGLDLAEFHSTVICLGEWGEMADRIASLGVPVHALNFRSSFPTPDGLRVLRRTLRERPADIYQGWMYHGNLVAQIAAALSIARRPPVLWNIRQTLGSLSDEKPGSALVIRALATMSKWPKGIIYNSYRSAEQHQGIGYSTARTIIVPNGFDLDLFQPCPAARADVRNELGLVNHAPLIGIVARYDPMKDHRTFLDAAALLHRRRSDVHFLMAGKNIDRQNAALMQQIKDLGLLNHVHLLGLRTDIPRITAALDILASSSSMKEGFSNSIGEAMACGVPCAVTDVGDSAWIVGSAGRIVPPKDPEKLAMACMDILEMEPDDLTQLSRSARQRIMDDFSLASVSARYASLYRQMANPAS